MYFNIVDNKVNVRVCQYGLGLISNDEWGGIRHLSKYVNLSVCGDGKLKIKSSNSFIKNELILIVNLSMPTTQYTI